MTRGILSRPQDVRYVPVSESATVEVEALDDGVFAVRRVEDYDETMPSEFFPGLIDRTLEWYELRPLLTALSN